MESKLESLTLTDSEMLKLFSEQRDNLVNTNPEIIRSLREKGYIQYIPVEVHSISALIEGKRSSWTVEHYIFTKKGRDAYKN